MVITRYTVIRALVVWLWIVAALRETRGQGIESEQPPEDGEERP